MAFGEATHRDKVLSSRERLLQGLESGPNLTAVQRRALDYEWANCLLMRGPSVGGPSGLDGRLKRTATMPLPSEKPRSVTRVHAMAADVCGKGLIAT